MLPRYFAPAASPEPLRAPSAALLSRLVDSLRPPWAPSAAVVGDRVGNLHLLDSDLPGSLPGPLRAALARHELARGAPARELSAPSVFLLAVEEVRQLPDTPGADDPVELRGVLFGPFGASAAPARAPGTLTVTRGDLLAGLVEGAAEALVTTDLAGRSTRCVHALLPGSDDAATAAGEGVVLAYPLASAELDPEDAANDQICASLLADVLGGLQADLRAAGSRGAFAKRPLPVASRADLERALERDGWEIEGDRAVRLDPRLKGGLGGLLTNVLGVPDGMTRPLPPEGTFDDFLALVKQALAELPGWPSARARALRARRHVAPATRLDRIPERAPDPPPPVATRRDPPPPKPALPREPAQPDWLSDFAPRRVTPVGRDARTTTAAPARPARPSWMDDFE